MDATHGAGGVLTQGDYRMTTSSKVREQIAALNRLRQAEWRDRQATCGWDDRYFAASDFEPPAPSITGEDCFILAGLAALLVAVAPYI